MGPFILTRLIFFYLTRSHGLSDEETGFWSNVATIPVAIATLCTTYPAGRLSDRLGRKPLIYASALIGSAGMLGVALAPSPIVAVMFAAVVGVGAGAFLAVDWALMTDIIPKASSGRYMGLSNVATASSGVLAIAIGGTLMDLVGGPEGGGLGPRAALALGVVFAAVLSFYLVYRAGEMGLSSLVYENPAFAIDQIDVQTDGVISPEQLRQHPGFIPFMPRFRDVRDQ